MKRLILDTSVLLSGAVSAPTSPPAVLLAAARAATFEVVACPRLFLEFQRGLETPYFRSRNLLDHGGLQPPAIDARAACELLRLI